MAAPHLFDRIGLPALSIDRSIGGEPVSSSSALDGEKMSEESNETNENEIFSDTNSKAMQVQRRLKLGARL